MLNLSQKKECHTENTENTEIKSRRKRRDRRNFICGFCDLCERLTRSEIFLSYLCYSQTGRMVLPNWRSVLFILGPINELKDHARCEPP